MDDKKKGTGKVLPEKPVRCEGTERKIRCPAGGGSRSETAIPLATTAFIAITTMAAVTAIVTVAAVKTVAAVMTVTAIITVAAGTTSAAPAIAFITATAAAIVSAATARRTTAAASTTTAAATRGAAIFGLADAQAPAAEVGSVELGDRGFSHLATGESDEGEPAWTTRFPVERHVQIYYGLVCREKFAQVGFRGVVRQISNIQFHQFVTGCWSPVSRAVVSLSGKNG